MSAPSIEPTGLVKVSVNLLPKAWAALEVAAEREGDTRTDAINRALQVFDAVTALRPGECITYADRTVFVNRPSLRRDGWLRSLFRRGGAS